MRAPSERSGYYGSGESFLFRQANVRAHYRTVTPPLPHGVPRPAEIDTDYGEPLEATCRQTAPGVFERRWSLATVALDCNAFTATFDRSPPPGVESA